MIAPGNSTKILALSDETVPYVYSPSVKHHFGEVDLIVGCGDLPVAYLEFVVSMLNKPLFYVPGNHDPNNYDVPGGQSVDGLFARHDQLLLAGAGGSIRYKPEGRHQYTQRQMYQRVIAMLPRMVLHRVLHGRGIDIFVSHASPHGIQDASDPAHVGFSAFHAVIQLARPRYLLHGHTHIQRNLEQSKTRVADTLVVNVYPQRVIDL
ncbi:MAG: metallophosphoesterase family protein [Anaerolineales bacterium]|jgi:Icc-related predicted phosphoesterase